MYFFKNNKNNTTIFYCPKTIFNEDIKQILLERPNVGYTILSRQFLRIIFKSSFNEKIEHLNFKKSHFCIKNLKKYENMIKFVLIPALKKIGVKYYITCDFIYYYERLLRELFFQENINTIIILKENIKSSAQHKAWHWYLENNEKKLSFVSKIFTFNNTMTNQLKNVFDIKDITIKTIAAPRINKLFNENSSKIIKKKFNRLVFFDIADYAGFPRFGSSYWPMEYLNKEYPKNKIELLKVGWQNVKISAYKILFEFAKIRTNWEIIIKTKEGFKYSEILKSKNLPNNCKTIFGGNATNIINDQTIIMAFNTSASFEGWVRGVPLITPVLEEARKKSFEDFLIPTNDLGYRISSLKELLSITENYSNNSKLIDVLKENNNKLDLFNSLSGRNSNNNFWEEFKI
ncbi:hypothetical protein OBA40_07435 [Alphaproteobacteria bacterium]|nr:hypothetical protein [Alphaproteobacteria bacterium]